MILSRIRLRCVLGGEARWWRLVLMAGGEAWEGRRAGSGTRLGSGSDEDTDTESAPARLRRPTGLWWASIIASGWAHGSSTRTGPWAETGPTFT